MRKTASRFLAAFVTFIGVHAGSVALKSSAMADDFYKSHRVKLIIGSSAGGSYDLVARMVGRNIGRLLPGEPTVIPQNMRGAASIKAANYVYNIAPQDGSVIATVIQDMPRNQLFGLRNVKYDASKFHWIGNPSSSVIVFAVWHTSPVKTIKDAMKRELIFSASSKSGADGLLPMVVNQTLGTKIKVVAGYGGESTMLAIERGEASGRGGLALTAWKAARPDWIKEGKIRFILQIGLKRDSELPNLPLAIDLAQSDEDRQVLKLFSTTAGFGYPILTGQNVPPERVKILRQAFRALMRDPKFLQEAKRSRIEIAPMYGEELQKEVASFLQYPPAIIARAKKMIGL